MSQSHVFPPTSISSSAMPNTNYTLSNVDDCIRCVRCQFGGCDLKVDSCGCSFHTRCFPLMHENTPINLCPQCGMTSATLSLYPMSFDEIDDAKREAAFERSKKSNEKRGRKRKNSLISQDEESTQAVKVASMPHVTSEPRDEKGGQELRTGRWTTEEMTYCDKLIECFKDGQLPLVEGTKLNDFLASILKSKQSRLTKKMKNAKLSTNTYVRKSSFIEVNEHCIEFSSLEDNFFLAISDKIERAQLKFHLRKLWRETFSDYCLSIGQTLDVDAWLSSVEEMDRRHAREREASRMQKRQLMMGYAFSHDSQGTEAGVYIDAGNFGNNEPIKPFSHSDLAFNPVETAEMLALLEGDLATQDSSFHNFLDDSGHDFDSVGKSSELHKSPFLTKIISYMKRYNVPFEHADIWVPSYQDNGCGKCVLGFAGCATADYEIPESGQSPAIKIEPDAQFNLLAFGDYSQKFSFELGCGLPGRVFESRSPTWNTGVNKGSRYFERSGGAAQWGIKTVVAIPIPSPNVGQIVVVLYSRHNRDPNVLMLSKLQDAFSKLLPTPKWKLVIDLGSPSAIVESGSGTVKPLLATARNSMHQPQTTKLDDQTQDIVNLLAEEMSSNVMSNISTQHCHDMISLRLLLLKPKKTASDTEIIETIVGSYTSYVASGRARKEIAIMISRDYAFMTQDQHSIPEVSIHYSDYLGPSPEENTSDEVQCVDPNQFDFKFSEFSGLDSNMNFYDLVSPDVDDYRPQSPTLTLIAPFEESKRQDNLSVVSN